MEITLSCLQLLIKSKLVFKKKNIQLVVLPIILFFISRLNNLVDNWYVGSILFFVEHHVQQEVFFLALVEMASSNSVSNIDKTIPITKYTHDTQTNKYCLIRLEDIVCKVGLLRTVGSSSFSVISQHIFKEDLNNTAGYISNV